jgi:hypothetical protein
MAAKEIDLMEALTSSLRHIERCKTCDDALPLPPEPRVCKRCGTVKITPLHGDWPHDLKVFLLLRYAGRNLFSPNLRTVQDSWELLLISNYEGGRFPSGRIIKQGVAPDDVFALAVKEAEEWKLAGAVTEFL